jgi:glycosyltransferase involved in cell wall biosynthesis
MQQDTRNKEIYISMPVSDFFGWGVCGKNLIRELNKKVKVRYVEKNFEAALREESEDKMVAELKVELEDNVNAPFIHTLTRNDGVSITEEMRGEFITCVEYRGKPNIGYIFSEQHYYNPENLDTLKSLDIMVAGSQWNADILKEAGVDTIAIPQGVDRTIFCSNGNKREDVLKDKFVIFSGGKYEHRKAQDLVIRAVSKLQQKYDDIYLMTSWANIFKEDNRYYRELSKVKNVLIVPLCYQRELVQMMRQTNIGLFPNRIEGGTNLVMMEYMACGKPVIANDSTGQADVIDDEYAFRVNGGDLKLLTEMIDRLEYAYLNRDKLEEMGVKAGEAMNNFTWGKMADRFLKLAYGTTT